MPIYIELPELTAEGYPKRRAVTHGQAQRGKKTSEYLIWVSMRQRVLNPKNKGFPNYGGRGIRICQRWQKSFANFLADMGPRPSKRHCLERRDNNGPYAPENCMWATYDQQTNNRRNNLLLTCQGRTQTAKQWAKELRLSYHVIRYRLQLGWPDERILSEPIKHISQPVT